MEITSSIRILPLTKENLKLVMASSQEEESSGSGLNEINFWEEFPKAMAYLKAHPDQNHIVIKRSLDTTCFLLDQLEEVLELDPNYEIRVMSDSSSDKEEKIAINFGNGKMGQIPTKKKELSIVAFQAKEDEIQELMTSGVRQLIELDQLRASFQPLSFSIRNLNRIATAIEQRVCCACLRVFQKINESPEMHSLPYPSQAEVDFATRIISAVLAARDEIDRLKANVEFRLMIQGFQTIDAECDEMN